MIFTVINAMVSDHYRQRTPFILLGVSVGIAGFTALLAIPHPQLPGLTYGMLFLATSGIYMSLVPTLCFVGKLTLQAVVKKKKSYSYHTNCFLTSFSKQSCTFLQKSCRHGSSHLYGKSWWYCRL